MVAKRKLTSPIHLKTNDESGTPRSQSGWKTSGAKKDDKEDECASRVVDSLNTNQWGKKEAGSSPLSSGYKEYQCASSECLILQTNKWAKRKLVIIYFLYLGKWAAVETNDESGTLSSSPGWRTSWAKKDDKEDECASRVLDTSNTNQWGKKEAGSSPSSSGKWAAMEN
ncbi:hypothetical protein Tco_1109584 [Tanacetum coccineum]